MATVLRFGSVPGSPGTDSHAGRLVIPSFSAGGKVVDVALRCVQPHECEGHPKYLFLPGIPKRLYHVESVTTTEPVIHITEGQLDAATLVACGLPAVGVPGAQSWKPHAHRLFGGFERVLFWADRDDKGASMELFAKIQQGLSGAEVMMVAEGEDLNSHYVKYGRESILALIEGEEPSEPEPPVVEHLDEQGRVIPF